MDILGGIHFLLYLCTRLSRGAHHGWAEMIPFKPDTGNADVGMDSYQINVSPFISIYFIKK